MTKERLAHITDFADRNGEIQGIHAFELLDACNEMMVELAYKQQAIASLQRDLDAAKSEILWARSAASEYDSRGEWLT